MTATVAPYVVWLFWALVIGLLAKRKNLNPWAWGLLGGLFWPVGLITLAFQRYRCGSCCKAHDSAKRRGGLCDDCLGTTGD